MDVVEVAKLYRQALDAKDELVRNILAQSVAQAAAAQIALDDALHGTVSANDTSEGPLVRRLQLRLAERGHDIKVDGKFGAKTKAALSKFQKAEGLKVDGVVGPVTWARLGVAAGDGVAEALATKAQSEIAAFTKLSKRAVKGNDLAAAEALAAEAVAAESLAAEAIAAEALAAEAAENQFSGEPLGAEAAIAEAAIAEGIAETSEALEAFVAEAVAPRA